MVKTVMIEAVMVEGTPDSSKRGCYDCTNLRGAVTLWCVDEDARQQGGTGSGVTGCVYWKPVKTLAELEADVVARRTALPWYMRWTVPGVDTSKMMRIKQLTVEKAE